MAYYMKYDPMIKDIMAHIADYANDNDEFLLSNSNGFTLGKIRGMIEIVEHLTGKDAYLSYDREADEWTVRFEEDDE